MDFYTKSYENHAKTYEENKEDKAELEKYKTWFDHPTVDLWRHERFLEVLDAFIECNPNANWLTVGDGRYGTSAQYIQRKGGKAVASDIDTALLEIAQKHQMIEEFQFQNAEKMTVADQSFDYSYCKMAYHHFPRPFLAVYEMLRCSREAIMFTEPLDFRPAPPTLEFMRGLKNKLRKMSGKAVPHYDDGNYEPSGNYIYSISEREFEKIALGLNLPMIATQVFHDVYIPGVEEEMMADNGPIFRKIKKEIRSIHRKEKLGLARPNHVSAIIFKKIPSDEVQRKLIAKGFKLKRLPDNPYV